MLRGNKSSDISQTIMGTEFVVEPEYLSNEEIKYELRIRGIGAEGNRRTITQRLRQTINEERTSPGAIRFISVGVPSQEYELVSKSIGRLQTLLSQVTNEDETQQRFMSVFLHLEGRLNRIAKVANGLDLTNVIFNTNETFSGLYHEFTEKIRLLKNPRLNAQAIANWQQQQLNQERENTIERNEFAAQDNGNNINTNERALSNQANARHSVAQGLDQSNQHLQSQSFQDSAIIEALRSENLSNDRFRFDSFSLMANLLQQNGAQHQQQRQQQMNATHNTNDRARLSQNFIREREQPPTPIGLEINRNTYNLDRPSQDIRQNNRIIDSNGIIYRNNGGNTNRPISVDFDSRSIRTPPPDFGNDRRNSLPINIANASNINNEIPRTFGMVDNGGRAQYQVNIRDNARDGVEQMDRRIGNEVPRNGIGTQHRIAIRNNYERMNRPIVENPRYENRNEQEDTLRQILQAVTSLSLKMNDLEQWKESFSANIGPNNNPNHNRRLNNPIVERNLGQTYTVIDNNDNRPIHDSIIAAQRPKSSSVPIHKWNWKFTADRTSKIPEERDLNAFFRKLELYREAEGTNYEEIYNKFHYLIGGSVYEWYIQYRRSFSNWQELKEGLSRQFTTPLTPFMAVAKLSTRRQGREETAMQYIAAVLREFDALNIYGEQERISIIQNGLLPRLRNLVIGKTWRSVQEMDLHLRTIEVSEELYQETGPKNRIRSFAQRRSIQALSHDEEYDSDENMREGEETIQNKCCHAVRDESYVRKKFNNDRNKKQDRNRNKEQFETENNRTGCFNCGDDSHMFRECPEEITGAFCFKCGKKDTITPKCGCSSKINKRVAMLDSAVDNEDQSNDEKEEIEKIPAKFSNVSIAKVNLNYDNRPYLFTKIFDQKVKGLMDSGAQSSIINEELFEKLKSQGLKLLECNVVVTTADGTGHKALGYVKIPFVVRDIKRTIPTLVVREAAVELILGWDFWTAYRIKPCFTSSAFGIQVVQGNEKTEEDPNETYNYEDFEADVSPPKCIKVETKHELNDEQKKALDEVMATFPFCNPEGELNKTHLKEAAIDIGNAKPVRTKMRFTPPAKLKKLIEETERLEARGIIRRVEFSEWLLPILCVPKPNGKIRVCLDARKLNEVTKKNSYPQQNANRILSLIGKTKYISTLDMTDAYYQIPLRTEDQLKTAFAVPTKGTYVYQRMPMGLCNSGSELCSLIDTLFGTEFEPNAFPYLDDIVVVSETFEEHLDILKRLAAKFNFANLSISTEKSKFCYKRLRYLGHIIDEEGVGMDKSRVEAIENFPKPKNVKEVQRLLGLAGWYRRFIQDFSIITAPISELIKKEVKFEWTKEREEAFRKLTKALISAPVLATPDYSLEFEIQCDACQIGCGAVLIQRQNGQEKVIAYMSQKFTATQRKYHVTEQECLAVILAIEKFRPYVEGTHFRVITDHHSLLWLKNLRDPTGRLARWALRLQGYNFTLLHRKGKHHVVPDALSRAISTIDIEEKSSDSWYNKLLSLANDKPQENDNLSIRNGLVYIKLSMKEECDDPNCLWRLCVPKEKRLDVLKANHDSENAMHFGRFKTTEKIREAYYWPKMNSDIAEYVKNCEVCKKIKPINHITTPPAGKSVEAKRPWRIIATDIKGPFPLSSLGNRFILVAVDLFSKFAVIRAVRNAEAKNVTQFIKNDVICRFGCPEIVVCDNGKQYQSKLFNEMLKQRNIRIWHTANYFAQANPTECVNKVIGTALKSFMIEELNHKSWDLHINEINCAINSAKHTSTGKSPYEVLFGMRMVQDATQYNEIVDVNEQRQLSELDRTRMQRKIQEKLNESYEKSHKRYNLRTREIKYKVGDTVYRNNTILSDATKYFCRKLAPKFIKCTIVEKTGTNTYKLRDEHSGKEAIHHSSNFHM